MIEKIEKAEKEPLKLSLETLSLQELEALLAYKRKEKIYISGSKKILFFLFLLFLILTISEGVSSYRVWKKSKKRQQEGAYRVESADTSHYKLTPHSEGVLSGAVFHINSQGFRGAEFEKEKQKKRIICIGDSLTFGWGALDEETYPAILGKLLAPDFEVINGGVIGYNTKNLIRRVEEDVFPLQPDLLICLIGWNNLREYVYTNLRPIPKPRHTVADHFALTEQFRNMHKRLDRSFKISHRKAVSATLDSQNHRLELPFLPEFREDLLRLTQRCEIEKIPLFFVSIPHFFKTELEEKARFELLDITLGVDLSYKGWIQVLEDLNAVVQEIAGASHFISIQQAVHEPSDFSDFCHPTPQANEKMAQILQPLIRRFFP